MRTTCPLYDRLLRAILGAVFLASASLELHPAALVPHTWVVDIAREHSAAIIGLPLAAHAALCLVVPLEISAGDIEIKGPGYEFNGAADL